MARWYIWEMSKTNKRKMGLWEKLFSKRKRDGWAERQIRQMAKIGARLVL